MTKPASRKEYMDTFAEIPVNTEVYKIRAYESPEDEDGLLIGTVKTTSKCSTSLYGDTKLNFKHQSLKDDMKLRPQWVEGYRKGCFCEEFLDQTKSLN